MYRASNLSKVTLVTVTCMLPVMLGEITWLNEQPVKQNIVDTATRFLTVAKRLLRACLKTLGFTVLQGALNCKDPEAY